MSLIRARSPPRRQHRRDLWLGSGERVRFLSMRDELCSNPTMKVRGPITQRQRSSSLWYLDTTLLPTSTVRSELSALSLGRITRTWQIVSKQQTNEILEGKLFLLRLPLHKTRTVNIPVQWLEYDVKARESNSSAPNDLFILLCRFSTSGNSVEAEPSRRGNSSWRF